MLQKLKNFPDLKWILLLWLIVLAYFFHIFLPYPKLLMTPDFGRSDATDISIADKYFYWQKIQANESPFWSANVGNGFPILGEGQTGVIYPLNFIFFKLFDFVIAYNLILITSVFIFGTGFYFLMRKLKLSGLASFFVSSSLMLSGSIIMHLQHITLLESLSLLPWVLLSALFIQKNKFWGIVFYSVTSALQLVSGFPQTALISQIFAIMIFGFSLEKKKFQIWRYITIFIGIILALGLAAVQLLPTYEFIQQTLSSGSQDFNAATRFSFPLKHLITFWLPYFWGNPKFGNYPAFWDFDGSIFWENSGYFGILPWILILYTTYIFLKNKLLNRQKSLFLLAFIISGVSFLLMLGKYSPLYILYLYWPLNLFRVPSRFIWTFVIGLMLIAGIGLDIIMTKISKFQRSLFIILIAVNLVQLIFTFSNYHLWVSAKTWLKEPEIVPEVSDGRILNIGGENLHNQIFLSHGWTNADEILFLRNNLSANSNLIWQVSNSNVFSGRILIRPEVLKSLIETTADDQGISLTPISEKFLNIMSIRYLISPQKINNETFIFKNSVTFEDLTLNVYENSRSLPKVYLVNDLVYFKSVSEIKDLLEMDDFIAGESVLTEKELPISNSKSAGKVKVIKETDTEFIAEVTELTGEKLLVLTDTYYPGWQAEVDGQKTQIYPINISQRGVLVPKGDHSVKFTYKPRSLQTGIKISVSTMSVISISIVIKMFFTKKVIKSNKNKQL